MKKLLSIVLALTMILAITGCGPKQEDPAPAADSITLNIFAAASMTETLGEIKEMYKSVAPEVELVLTLDSSGTLKTQIEEGADCDLFISAAQKQMDGLEEGGLVNTQTRCNILENKCVLAVPEGNPAGIESFEDLGTDKLSLIALGNSDVPVGQYSEEIFKFMGIWDQLNADGKITFGSNVKEVTAQIESGAVDCGVVYGTDAAAAGLAYVCAAPEGSHKPVIYPAAVMTNAAQTEAASAFLEYLKGEACSAVFEAAGFAIAK